MRVNGLVGLVLGSFLLLPTAGEATIRLREAKALMRADAHSRPPSRTSSSTSKGSVDVWDSGGWLGSVQTNNVSQKTGKGTGVTRRVFQIRNVVEGVLKPLDQPHLLSYEVINDSGRGYYRKKMANPLPAQAAP